MSVHHKVVNSFSNYTVKDIAFSSTDPRLEGQADDFIMISFNETKEKMIFESEPMCCELLFFIWNQEELHQMIGKKIEKIVQNKTPISHEFFTKQICSHKMTIVHDPLKPKIFVSMCGQDVCECKTYDIYLNDRSIVKLNLFTVSNGYYHGLFIVRSDKDM